MTILSQSENDFLTATFGELTKSAWIGLIDDGSSWLWVDGQSLDYTNWDGQPVSDGLLYCAIIFFPDIDGKWREYDCETYEFASIIEVQHEQISVDVFCAPDVFGFGCQPSEASGIYEETTCPLTQAIQTCDGLVGYDYDSCLRSQVTNLYSTGQITQAARDFVYACLDQIPTKCSLPAPSAVPSGHPTSSWTPSASPSSHPTIGLSATPTSKPTLDVSSHPTLGVSSHPTLDVSLHPTIDLSLTPSTTPTFDVSLRPTTDPSFTPTNTPTLDVSLHPTVDLSRTPTTTPTFDVSLLPTMDPSFTPTTTPTLDLSLYPTSDPSIAPTAKPTIYLSTQPTIDFSVAPASSPASSAFPSSHPSSRPTFAPASGNPLLVSIKGIPTMPILVGETIGSVTVICNNTAPSNILLTFDWGDGHIDSTIVVAPSSCQSSFSHLYVNAGIYIVEITAKDVTSGGSVATTTSSSSSRSYDVVVFDPSAGYLTAGDMQFQNGRATFGLVCTYEGHRVLNSTVVVSVGI